MHQISCRKCGVECATERQGGYDSIDLSREKWTPEMFRLPQDCSIKGILCNEFI